MYFDDKVVPNKPDETVYVPTLHRKVLAWFFLNCPRKRSSNPCYAIDVKSNSNYLAKWSRASDRYG